jgi:hypothetical protein
VKQSPVTVKRLEPEEPDGSEGDPSARGGTAAVLVRESGARILVQNGLHRTIQVRQGRKTAKTLTPCIY